MTLHASTSAIGLAIGLGTNLTGIDWLIMLVYFAFVLGIGFLLKRHMRSSTDFFLAGRALPAWVCGLAFISANLGAQEVIGMGASGAKYGIVTSQFYWIGAIPAMVFIGLFMMPFYYGSKARSVPEYLRLRLRRKDAGVECRLIRHHDGFLLRHFDVCHGQTDSGAAYFRRACSCIWVCLSAGFFTSRFFFPRLSCLATFRLAG